MSKYFLKNGKCRKLFFRPWKWSKDKLSKIYPKTSKYFPIDKEADCNLFALFLVFTLNT